MRLTQQISFNLFSLGKRMARLYLVCPLCLQGEWLGYLDAYLSHSGGLELIYAILVTVVADLHSPTWYVTVLYMRWTA